MYTLQYAAIDGFVHMTWYNMRKNVTSPTYFRNIVCQICTVCTVYQGDVILEHLIVTVKDFSLCSFSTFQMSIKINVVFFLNAYSSHMHTVSI